MQNSRLVSIGTTVVLATAFLAAMAVLVFSPLGWKINLALAVILAALVLWYAKAARDKRQQDANFEGWLVEGEEILLGTRRHWFFRLAYRLLAVAACICVIAAIFFAATGKVTWEVSLPANNHRLASAATQSQPASPVSSTARGGQSIAPARGGQATSPPRHIHIPLWPVLLIAALLLLIGAFVGWLWWISNYILVTNFNAKLLKLPPFWLPFASEIAYNLPLSRSYTVNYKASFTRGNFIGLGTVIVTTIQPQEDDKQWANLFGWPNPKGLHDLLQQRAQPHGTQQRITPVTGTRTSDY